MPSVCLLSSAHWILHEKILEHVNIFVKIHQSLYYKIFYYILCVAFSRTLSLLRITFVVIFVGKISCELFTYDTILFHCCVWFSYRTVCSFIFSRSLFKFLNVSSVDAIVLRNSRFNACPTLKPPVLAWNGNNISFNEGNNYDIANWMISTSSLRSFSSVIFIFAIFSSSCFFSSVSCNTTFNVMFSGNIFRRTNYFNNLSYL